MKQRVVLFDIDGTLLHSMGAGRRALLAAMADFLPDPSAASREVRFDGKTDPQIVSELLAAAGRIADDAAQLTGPILERYVGLLALELGRPGHVTRVLPGIPALLDRIESEQGAVLGLLTGNVAEGARLKLAAAGLAAERFVLGAYGSDDASRTRLPGIAATRAVPAFGRLPRGDEMVIVGDTPADVACAAAAGARAVAVATGSYSVAQLREAGADAVFETLESSDEVWEAVWG